MGKMRILAVEDTTSTTSMWSDRFAKIHDMSLRVAPSAEVAKNFATSDGFDLAFVDLRLTENSSVYTGIPLAEELRHLSRDAVIVMYSGDIQPGFLDPSIEEKCRKAGADHVKAFDDLLSMPATELREYIISCVAKKKEELEAQTHFSFAADWRTKAVCEIVQEDILRALVTKCISNKKYFAVHGLQAGYSGAVVLRVRASTYSDFTDSVSLIVKISRSEFALADELRRRPVAGSLFDTTSVLPPHSQKAIPVADWHAIAVREVKSRTLLRDFLVERSLQKGDEKVLQRLVSELLVQPAQQSKGWSELTGPRQEEYSVKYSAGVEVLDFLVRAEASTHVVTSSLRKHARDVRSLVENILSERWGFSLAGRQVALLHGDFHTRNVFVAADAEALLIDFGRSEVYPRLFDFAALDADLLLSVMDQERGLDLSLNQLRGWKEAAMCGFPFSDSRRPPRTRAVYLRQCLHHALTNDLTLVTKAEYGEALLFNLLRYLRFTSITFPKKLLAVALIREIANDLKLISGH